MRNRTDVTPRPLSPQLLAWKHEFCWDLIREDGRLERTCSHGVGHTVGHVRGYLLKYDDVHGCDGCCAKWGRMLSHLPCLQCGRVKPENEFCSVCQPDGPPPLQPDLKA
jgi:hypothetical protein